jgi:hypothetical protein
MSKVIPQCPNPTYLNKKQLVNLKTKAMRSGAWFKVSRRIDRVLFDVTVRVVDNIRRSQLAKSMLALIRKLENGVKGGFSGSLAQIGLSLAQKIISTAQKLGNLSNTSWLLDSMFIRFLAVMRINDAKTLKL